MDSAADDGSGARNKLTDYWKEYEIKEGEEFAILTNIIHQEWADVTVREHKQLKGLKNQNLRDHMSEAELIFTALAELSTRQMPSRPEQQECKKIRRRQKRAAALPKGRGVNSKAKRARVL